MWADAIRALRDGEPLSKADSDRVLIALWRMAGFVTGRDEWNLRAQDVAAAIDPMLCAAMAEKLASFDEARQAPRGEGDGR